MPTMEHVGGSDAERIEKAVAGSMLGLIVGAAIVLPILVGLSIIVVEILVLAHA